MPPSPTTATFNPVTIFRRAAVAEPTRTETKTSRIDQLKAKLASAGQAGLVAYGLLNCVYYLSLTAIAWTWTSKGADLSFSANLPFKQKYVRVVTRLGKVSLTVWAGSQATKAFRIIAAISMAPATDKVIDFTKDKLKFKRRGSAVTFIIASLLSISALFYFTLVFGSVLFAGKRGL